MNNVRGIFTEEEIQKLKGMEFSKKSLLEKEEAECRLKTRAIWLAKGDENTKFF